MSKLYEHITSSRPKIVKANKGRLGYAILMSQVDVINQVMGYLDGHVQLLRNGKVTITVDQLEDILIDAYNRTLEAYMREP